jgi:hypothetical protein
VNKTSKDLEKFTSSSLRGQKQGIYEHSQCKLIMKGIDSNDPLIKISTICEGALLSEKKKKLDLDLIKTCNDVCVSFQRTFPTKTSNYEYYNVAWMFPSTDENYERYIKPWHKISLIFYPLATNYRRRNYPISRKLIHVSTFEQIDHHNEVVEWEDRLQKKIEGELAKTSDGFQFFTETSALITRSYNILQGEFTSWALAELSDIRRALQKEISPDVWKDFNKPEPEGGKEDSGD